MLRKLPEVLISKAIEKNCLRQDFFCYVSASIEFDTRAVTNECSQLRTRPLRISLQTRRLGRDIRADLNSARPLVRVVDFERVPCPRRDAHWLGIRSRDDGVFTLEGEDVASGGLR